MVQIVYTIYMQPPVEVDREDTEELGEEGEHDILSSPQPHPSLTIGRFKYRIRKICLQQ
jgi:hypothetical protein